MQAITGALAVVVFDHNVRSAARAARGEHGVGCPSIRCTSLHRAVRPEAQARILDAAGRSDLANLHAAFVNLWRPIVGPVLDNPFAVCDAAASRPRRRCDRHPSLRRGRLDRAAPQRPIESVRYNPKHRRLHVSENRPDKFLLLECYDSRADGRARFMPHTGFRNPACPSDFVPRESIEARTW